MSEREIELKAIVDDPAKLVARLGERLAENDPGEALDHQRERPVHLALVEPDEVARAFDEGLARSASLLAAR